MKTTAKHKSIKTIPQGVWESSRSGKKEKEHEHKENISTDLQGNGYPDSREKN